MAVKTQAQLLAEVQSLLVDNSQIRASAVRTLEEDIIDTMFSLTGGAKVYRALLTQTGTDAPVATVLHNALGGTVVWTYGTPGQYIATLTGAFTSGKTFILMGTGALVDRNNAVCSGVWSSINEITVATSVLVNSPSVAFVDIDEELFDTPIEIIVYP